MVAAWAGHSVSWRVALTADLKADWLGVSLVYRMAVARVASKVASKAASMVDWTVATKAEYLVDHWAGLSVDWRVVLTAARSVVWRAATWGTDWVQLWGS